MTRQSEKRPLLAPLWPQKRSRLWDREKIPPFRWGQHRVCLDMGQAPALPNTVLRAEARTHFQNGGEREKRHHIQHSDSL